MRLCSPSARHERHGRSNVCQQRSGVYSLVTRDSVELALADGSHVQVNIGGVGMAGSLALVRHGVGDGMKAWWEAGLASVKICTHPPR